MTLLKKCKNNAGFTLMELLIVIVIIGIIGGLGGGYYLTSLRRGRDGKRSADLNNLRNALEMYYLDNENTYPNPTGGLGSYTSVSNLESDLVSGSSQYIKVLPTDPQESQGTEYLYSSNGSCYCISADMEMEESARTEFGDCTCPDVHDNCYLVTCP
ncbi:MAG: prepilin-type N-terminal cleavage/methylation domain-containing protein [Patescibacteria group bacterium]|nr:prepilin-type N-terminal cleavage/methylation domain-containing protein [Patescibacteria group bacterium]